MNHPDRFPASVLWRHADDMSHIYFTLINGGIPSADDITNLGNCAGNLNMYRDKATPAPTPTDTTIQERLKVSQNCAWGNLYTSADGNWVDTQSGFDPAEVKQHLQYYNGEGGGVRLNSAYNTNATVGPVGWVFNTEDGKMTADVDGAADKYIATIRNNVPKPLGAP